MSKYFTLKLDYNDKLCLYALTVFQGEIFLVHLDLSSTYFYCLVMFNIFFIREQYTTIDVR